MRPIIRGSVPLDPNGNEIKFKGYQEAKKFLIDRIGEYCSYCERKINAGIAVEHVQPKDSVPDLKLNWDNFLLACVNCNSTKNNQTINLPDYFWPDKNCTYSYFQYDHQGIVTIPDGFNEEDYTKIQNMISLVGLDKHPPIKGSIEWKKASDKRYEHRIQAWKEANEFLVKYESVSEEVRRIILDHIITIVKHQGFWSIWMKIFENYPEVQRRLVTDFQGTNKNCFPELFPDV